MSFYIGLCLSFSFIQTGDWCVLSQLGWIDENGNEKNETTAADLMSLNAEVGTREGLSGGTT